MSDAVKVCCRCFSAEPRDGGCTGPEDPGRPCCCPAAVANHRGSLQPAQQIPLPSTHPVSYPVSAFHSASPRYCIWICVSQGEMSDMPAQQVPLPSMHPVCVRQPLLFTVQILTIACGHAIHRGKCQTYLLSCSCCQISGHLFACLVVI